MSHPQAPGHGGYPPPAKRPYTVPTPGGVPYHRMARSEVHRWWRPLLGSLTIAVGGFGLGGGVLFIGLIIHIAVTGEPPEGLDDPSATSVFGNDLADIAYALLSLAVFLPVVAFVAWWIQRRRPGTLSSVAGRLRPRWLLACSGMALLFCAVSFALAQAAGTTIDGGTAAGRTSGAGAWVGWDDFLLPLLVIVALVPLQSAAEEYVFRGWLLQGVGACTLENAKGTVTRALSTVFRTPWPGIVIGAALFTAGHAYTGWGILDVFLFGVIAGWLTVRTGGLEATIALHVFNNLKAFLLPAAFGVLEISQGSVPWQYVVADVAAMAVFAAGTVLLARRYGIRATTPDSAARPRPTAV